VVSLLEERRQEIIHLNTTKGMKETKGLLPSELPQTEAIWLLQKVNTVEGYF